MENNKTIQVIHASDADQHLGCLMRILDSFKEEKRIISYKTIDSKTVNDDYFKVLGVNNMVIMLLTNNIVENKTRIEDLLLEIKKRKPSIKIAEVIVDNLPYESSFTVFPTSLEPIRSSEDMDGIWQDIEGNLKKMFKKHEIKPSQVKSAWKRGLSSIFGLLTGLVQAISYIFLGLLSIVGWVISFLKSMLMKRPKT